MKSYIKFFQNNWMSIGELCLMSIMVFFVDLYGMENWFLPIVFTLQENGLWLMSDD